MVTAKATLTDGQKKDFVFLSFEEATAWMDRHIGDLTEFEAKKVRPIDYKQGRCSHG